MKAYDVLEYAVMDFTSNKFKTMLSSLGIIIGVLAIVAMLTFGDALQAGVSSQFGSLELDTMAVIPGTINMGAGPGTAVQKAPAKLTDRDVNIIMGTPGVKEVYPEISAGGIVTYKGENRSLSVVAVEPQHMQRYATLVDKGRYLTTADTNSVVIGSKVANGTFGKRIAIGSYINITSPYTDKSQSYLVAGIMQERNGSILTGDPNSEIIMTRAGIKTLTDQDTFSYIAVRSDTVDGASQTATNVENALQYVHRNEGFSVLTQKMFVDMISSVFSLIKTTLAGIGAISLVVGAIGIMNVMMLTVRERVKEIGLMKAVGATRSDVRVVFLVEAVLLGLFSGTVGVVI
ncbi:MAG TPA: ABC transporter permease, partial [Methanocella sp.]|nr:ABC transporter permease [Methanocella sp.]